MVTDLSAGTPSVREVLGVVRTALHEEVVPATMDRPQYVVRMACRLLDIVGRELESGDRRAVELGERLQAIGVRSEADLAAGLVEGRFDPNADDIRRLIHELVGWRLTIARPNDHRAASVDP